MEKANIYERDFVMVSAFFWTHSFITFFIIIITEHLCGFRGTLRCSGFLRMNWNTLNFPQPSHLQTGFLKSPQQLLLSCWALLNRKHCLNSSKLFIISNFLSGTVPGWLGSSEGVAKDLFWLKRPSGISMGHRKHNTIFQSDIIIKLWTSLSTVWLFLDG